MWGRPSSRVSPAPSTNQRFPNVTVLIRRDRLYIGLQEGGGAGNPKLIVSLRPAGRKHQ
jgi:hypothetical protein